MQMKITVMTEQIVVLILCIPKKKKKKHPAQYFFDVVENITLYFVELYK